MKNISFFLLLSIGVFSITGCAEDADQIYEEQQTEIMEYLRDKGWLADAVNDGDGIWFYLEEEGTGVDYPSVTSTVTVHYEGRLIDNTKFDSSIDRGQPSTFSLGRVIEGWRRGIPKFRKGDKGYLLIPSKYGYGAAGSGASIPGHSTLVFYIEMIDFD